MSLAFRMTETMSGLHCFVDPALGAPDERRWSFRVRWGSALGTAAWRGLRGKPIENAFTGDVTIDGLTHGEVPCEGTLTLDYRAGLLTYTLSFDVDGRRHTLVAEKREVDLTKPFELSKTHTTAYGVLRDDTGRVLSRGVLHFRPETLGAFLRSFRVVAG
jgi:hypothetical protein